MGCIVVVLLPKVKKKTDNNITNMCMECGRIDDYRILKGIYSNFIGCCAFYELKDKIDEFQTSDSMFLLLSIFFQVKNQGSSK